MVENALTGLELSEPEALAAQLPPILDAIRRLDPAGRMAFAAELRPAIAAAATAQRIALLDAICTLFYANEAALMAAAIAADDAPGVAASLTRLLDLGPSEVPNQGPYRDALLVAMRWYYADRSRPADALLPILDDAIARWAAPAQPVLDVLCDITDFHFHAVWSFEASSLRQCARALPAMRASALAMARTAPPPRGRQAASGPVHIAYLAMFADPSDPMTVALRHVAPALLADGRFRLTVLAWSNVAEPFLDWLRGLGAVCHRLHASRSTLLIEDVEALAAVDPPAVVISDMNNAVPTALFARRLAPLQVYLQGGLPAWPVPNLDAVFNSFGLDPAAAGWGDATILPFEPPWDLPKLNPPVLPDEVAAERAALPQGLRLIGHYGRLVKVTEPCLRAAERILLACPDVAFVTGGSGDGAAIRAFIAASPVGARMHVADRWVPGQSWGRLLTLFLDTWPLSGGESCREAIAKGVPVLALRNEEMPAIDRQRDPALLADDWDGFVAEAVRLLGQPAALAQARARASALAARMANPVPFAATLGAQLDALLAALRARQVAADPREAFDAALIPGMRHRLAQAYAGFRAREARAVQAMAVGGALPYRLRDCPGCGHASAGVAPVLQAHGMELLDCPGCGLTYTRQVMEEAADAARYAASDLDAASLALRVSPPYLELESARDRYYLHRLGLPPGRLLEVGAGTGTLLLEAGAAGWQAWGLEPGRSAAWTARSRGARVLHGYFPADLPSELGRFDAIALLDVLEHFADPLKLLAQLRAALAPGGRLLVQVPNWDSPLVRLEGARSSVVCPGHWSYFTPATLPALLARAGFRAVSVETVVSEIDRIAAHPPEAVAAVIQALRPGAPPGLPDPAGLHALGLGYKLLGVFEA